MTVARAPTLPQPTFTTANAKTRAMQSQPPELSPQQIEFLAQFADNYHLGRKILCKFAHAMVALGTLAGAIVSLKTAFPHWFGAN